MSHEKKIETAEIILGQHKKNFHELSDLTFNSSETTDFAKGRIFILYDFFLL